MQPLKVFVSSTFVDLQAERAAVESALDRLRTAHFVGMEHFGARSEDATTVSLDELDRCDLYVGVIGLARGSGITEREYRRAIERRMGCLIYQRRLAPGDDASLDPRLLALREEMRQRHVVVEYSEPQELALRLVVDLHREVVERLSARHESGLVRQAEQAIRLFVAEYVGDGAEPTIFGGREAELRQLDRWLDDTASPSQAVLTAPAGRGKSALLVNWVRRLTARRDLHVIFFPISIRFGTHLAAQAYATLATRLAALHGEPVATADESASDFWRGLLISLLMRPLPAGVRAIVVLDGADEGGDWQPGPDLLPTRLPDGIRMLVSARHLTGDTDAGGWLERLGWSRPGQAMAMELRPLTPAGVVALLRGLSVPLERFGERADVVAELYRLSEGDPLLVKLYVADLWAMGDEVSRLQPEDLQAIEPGLDGYFKRWWTDQRRLWGHASPLREPMVNDLLNTLACALGPLQTDVLLSLVPSDSNLDVWSLEEALQALRRFVVGDGSRQGYVFGHPRLADHFYDQLARGGRARRHEQRFVEWGVQELQRAEADPSGNGGLPTYVPQFLRRHMERCGSPPEVWVRLVTPSWLHGWEPLDRGSHMGFLADLLRAQEIVGHSAAAAAAAGEASPWPLVELRATLYASSLATLAADLSPPLLATLARRAIWTPAQAIAQASRIPGRAARTAALVWLTTALEADFRPLPMAAAVAELRAHERDGVPAPELSELLEALKPVASVGEAFEQHGERLAVLAQVARQLGAAAREALCIRLLDWISKLHYHAEPEVAMLLQLQPWLDGAPGAAASARVESLRVAALDTHRPLVHPLLRERLAALRGMLAAPPVDRQHQVTRELMQTVLGLCVNAVREGASDRGHAIDQVLAAVAWLPAFAPEVTRSIGRWLDPRQLERFLLVTVNERPSGLRRRHLEAVLEAVPRADLASVRAELVTELLSGAKGRAERLERLVAAAPLLDADSVTAAFDSVGPDLEPEVALIALDSLVRSVDPSGRAGLVGRALSLLSDPAPVVARALLDVHLEPGCRDSWDVTAAPASPELAAAVRRLLRAAELGSRPPLPARTIPNASPLLTPTVSALVREWSGDLADLVLSSRMMLLLRPENIVAGLPHVDTEETLGALAELSPFVSGPALRAAVSLALESQGSYFGFDAKRLLSVASAACAPALRPPTDDTLAHLDAAAAEIWSFTPAEGRSLAEQARATALPDSLREVWTLTALRAVDVPEIVMPSGEVKSSDSALLDWIADDACRIVEPGTALTKALLAAISRGLGQDAAVDPWVSLTDRVPMRDMLAPLCESVARRDLWPAVQAGRARRADAFWTEVLEAAAQHPSEDVRCAALRVVAENASDAVVAGTIELIGEIRALERRIDALALVAGRLPGDVRARVVHDLESMLRAGAVAAAQLPEALVRLLGSSELAAEHLSARVEAALNQWTSERRQHAVLDLEASLDDASLSAAVIRLQRLGDVHTRLHALRALALRARGSATEPAALERLRDVVRSAVSPAERSAVILACSSLLPPSERWELLREALAASTFVPEGFDTRSLVADLSLALRDAPAAVCSGTLDWITRQASLDGLGFVVAVGTQFPASLLWLAHSRIGGAAEIWDRLLTPAARNELGSRRREPPRATLQLIEALEKLRADRRPPAPDERSPRGGLVRGLQYARSELTRSRTLREWALSRRAVEEELPLAVEAFEALGDPELRDGALAHLALWADSTDRDVVQRTIGRISVAADRAWALLVLAGRCPVVDRASLYDDAVDALRHETDVQARMTVAAEFAARVPERVPVLLDFLVTPRPEPYAVDALASLLPRLPDAAADVLLRNVTRIEDALVREHLASACVPLPGERSAASAFALLEALDGEAARARVLSVLASSLPDALRAAADAALDQMTVDHAWLLALRALASRWPTLWTEDRLSKALALHDAIGDDEDRFRWLDAVLPYWPTARWLEFERMAARLGDSGLRGELLAAAVTRPDIETAALRDAMRAMSDPYQRAVALGRLAALRGDDSLWPEVIAGATAAGGQHLVVEAATVIATGARRVPAPLFDLLTSRPARWHSLVVTALEHLSEWLDREQVEVVRAWPAFAGAASRLWPELDAADAEERHRPSQVEAEAIAVVEARRAAEAIELAAAIRAARRRLSEHLSADSVAASAGAIASTAGWKTPAPTGLARFRALESMADRVQVALQTIAGAERGRVGELMRAMRSALDEQRWAEAVAEASQRYVIDPTLIRVDALRRSLDAERWGEAVDAAWDRWVIEDAAAAIDAALGLDDPEMWSKLLARTPSALLRPARACLHRLWQQRLDNMRLSRRADALAELARLASVVECLGGESALSQAMDEVQSACALWP